MREPHVFVFCVIKFVSAHYPLPACYIRRPFYPTSLCHIIWRRTTRALLQVKVKRSIRLIKHHNTKTYGGWGSGGVDPHILNIGTIRCEWSASRFDCPCRESNADTSVIWSDKPVTETVLLSITLVLLNKLSSACFIRCIVRHSSDSDILRSVAAPPPPK